MSSHVNARESATNEERAFCLVSGHRVLDLLATLRERHLEPVECLREPKDLDRWLELAGFSIESSATQADLGSARELRETVNRLVRATLAGDGLPRHDRSTLNEWAREPALAPQVGPKLDLRWSGGVRAALATLAREAGELLTSPQARLIRECAAAPNCSRLYLDRSRGRRRRWCRMEWCGSSAKMRAYRQRLIADHA